MRVLLPQATAKTLDSVGLPLWLVQQAATLPLKIDADSRGFPCYLRLACRTRDPIVGQARIFLNTAISLIWVSVSAY